jgi:hypothetical protein
LRGASDNRVPLRGERSATETMLLARRPLPDVKWRLANILANLNVAPPGDPGQFVRQISREFGALHPSA